MPKVDRFLGVGLALLMVGCDRAEEPAAAPQTTASQIEPLVSPAPPGAAEGNLLIRGSGELLMSWIQEDESGASLQMAGWDGTRWSRSRQIARGGNWFVNWADFPALVEDRRGRLYAHWLEREGDATYAYGVRVVHSDDGIQWSQPVRPHSDDAGTEHGFVSYFLHLDGTPGLAWLDGRKTAGSDGHEHAGTMTLRAGRIEEGGVVDHELDATACDCCQTDAALTPAGPVVVYRDRDAQETRDIAIVSHRDGRWQAPRKVAEDGWIIAACPVNGPAVAVRGQELAVAWFTMAGGDAAVKLVLSSDGGDHFGAALRLDRGSPLGRVDVAYLSTSDLVVSWLENQGEEAVVTVARVQNGAIDQTLEVGRTSPARSSGFPRLAVFDDRLVVLWREVQADGAGLRLATIRLDAKPEADS